MAEVDVNEALMHLGSKVEQLILRHEQTLAANAKLRTDKRQAEMLIDEQAKAIAELTEKNMQMVIGDAVAHTSMNKNEAREKIDQIVQEIDKCIALLNNK
jgi:hypothetical protein